MKHFIFGFIIGGALSGVSTYFITKNLTEKKAQLHIQNMRKEYKKMYEPKKAAVQKDDPSEIVKNYEEKAQLYSEDVDPAEVESPEDDAPDEYYGEETVEMDNDAYNYDKLHRNKGVRLISEDDFGQAPGFDSHEVSYYTDDDTYVYDENDQVIDDPSQLFGSVIRGMKWDEDDKNTDDICIRNFAISTDFRITKNFAAYEMTV